MISPEVINFPAPRTLMQSGTSTLDTTLQRIESTYTEQHLHGVRELWETHMIMQN